MNFQYDPTSIQKKWPPQGPPLPATPEDIAKNLDRECQRLQAENAKLHHEIEALHAAIGSLKDFVEGARRETENISAILGGAIRVTTSGIGTS